MSELANRTFHPNLSSDVIPNRQTSFYIKKIPCCLLLMDEKHHLITHLDDFAAEVWKLCTGSHTVGEILKTLGTTAENSLNIERDLFRVLDTLREYEAIDLHPAGHSD